jgi:HAE1 family hydrophobic/amphiphilic exporter-1
MKLIDNSIRYPVTTTVGVILLVLFGTLALLRIPVQLVPNVEEPKVTVTTVWPGASPQEIEREIVDEQEEQLKNLEGLLKMESECSDSVGRIVLTFPVGTPVEAAAVRVSNKLDQVLEYPTDVKKPVITTVDLDSSAISWMVVGAREKDGYQGDIAHLYDFIEDFVKPAFERVPGAAASNIYGGREREMQVIVDPARLAARQVTLAQMAAALDRENRNFSGGDFDEGKRRYVVRTIGDYTSEKEIENVVVTVRHGVPVYVRDVARVELGFKKTQGLVFFKGQHVLAMNVIKQPAANVLEVMAGVKKTIDTLNRDLLGPRGLYIKQVYDETDYIYSSIQLVKNSLYVGGALATLCLLLFLRSWTSTLVIAVAIPISIVGAFLFLNAAGRTLNVISLAGMAFAAGMVVDNSVVVLENIYRHRQMGKSRSAAALDGSREVWGAVLASTLTTLAVFIPVVFIQEEAGQLFADIAIAISAAVGLSLVVSITVVPSMSAKILHAVEGAEHEKGYHNLWGVVRLGEKIRNGVGAVVARVLQSVPARLVVVSVMTAAALLGSWLLMPKAEYLPTGNTNFAFGLILPPPGYNVDEVAALRHPIEDEVRPLWEATPGTPEAHALPGGGVESFFYVAIPGMSFMGVRSQEPLRLRELLPPIQQTMFQLPGSIGFITQASLFQRGFGEGRNIDVQITGPQLETLVQHGGRIFGQVLQKMPGAQVRPIPSLDLGNPEVQVLTHRRRAADVQISNRELGFAVNALVDGAKVSDYRHEGRKIDLMLRGEDAYAQRTDQIEIIPIATPDGRLVTLGTVADVVVANGPTQINRRERQRAITIQVEPPEQLPLESAMELIENEIVAPMKQDGSLGGLYQVNLSGSADKLTQTLQAFRWNFVLAVVITYLLMAALFENFLHPLVIMFSVPLGAVGGFIGLKAMNLFLSYQPMDILTMLGFIILVGTVVNNAILVVSQSLNHMRDDGMEAREAIREAVQNRMRPMFMTTGTTVFGMLPLVLFPGAGSELYRGIGAVVIGGLLVGTLFTLFLVPSLFSLALDAQAAVLRVWTRFTTRGAKPRETPAD